jgi:hypothetical protein
MIWRSQLRYVLVVSSVSYRTLFVTDSIRGLLVQLANISRLAALTFQTPVSMKPPPRKHLPVIHDATDTWTAYPQGSHPEPAHRNCIHNQSFDLHLIIYEIVEFFYSDKEQTGRSYANVESMVQSFDTRLMTWLRQLPACIRGDQAWTPGVLEVQLVFPFSAPLFTTR